MTLPKAIGELVPGALTHLVVAMRAKYQIPDPGPDKDPVPDLLAGDFPFEQIRADILAALRADPPFEPPIGPLVTLIRNLPSDQTLSSALTAFAQTFPPDRTIGNTIQAYVEKLLEPHLSHIVDMLFAYVLTGETKQIPTAWLGQVTQVPLPSGQTQIVLIANQFSDLPQLVAELRRKFRATFPTRPLKLSHTSVDAAANLRLKKEGYKLKDIADIYIGNHPSEFPRNPRSPEYRALKKQLEARIKKQMDRLRSTLSRTRDT